MTETQLVHATIKALHSFGWPAWRNNTGGERKIYKSHVRFIRYGPKGGSDIFAIRPRDGKFVALEAKVGKRKPTKEQQIFLDEVHNANAVAIVFYDRVEDALIQLGLLGDG